MASKLVGRVEKPDRHLCAPFFAWFRKQQIRRCFKCGQLWESRLMTDWADYHWGWVMVDDDVLVARRAITTTVFGDDKEE